MTPEERKLLTELFERVQSAAGNRRDPEAEAFIAENVRAQPYAPYLLAQAVIVQEEGLKNAATRIEELERQLEEARGAQGGGGFLGSIFGGQRPQHREEAPPPPSPGPWSYQRGSVPSAGPQGGWGAPPPQQGGWGGGPMSPQAPGQPPGQGGSFLRGALGAAAGVAGGVLLADTLRGLFTGGNNAHGIAGDLTRSGGSGSAADLASHDDSNIAGNIFDDKRGDQTPGQGAEGAQPASYDDDQDQGGWDDPGGDDSSYDV